MIVCMVTTEEPKKKQSVHTQTHNTRAENKRIKKHQQVFRGFALTQSTIYYHAFCMCNVCGVWSVVRLALTKTKPE